MSTGAQGPPLDLENYASNYSGHAKICRLDYIAEKSVGTTLEIEALKLLHDELKKSENTSLYASVCERINGRLGPNYKIDRQWMDSMDRRAQAKHERLETELHGFKTNLFKESIRMGQNDLGDFFYERGHLLDAFKCYVRSRDYCTTSRHIINMCLNVIKVAVELSNSVHVANYVAKAESTPDLQSDPIVCAKVTAASGLALLHGKRYRQAACKFSEVSSELGNSYNNVLAPQDIALYGVLCGLATLDRSELHRRYIANLGFKEFLEVVPEVRQLLLDFHNCRYSRCLKSLDQMMPVLSLDLHLAGHIQELYRQMRQQALVQYTAPFSSVDLQAMSTAFSLTKEELINELAKLIMDGAVQARIDSHAGVLYARRVDPRANSFEAVLSCGEDYLRNTKALLLRANMLKHDFVHKPRAARGAAEQAAVMGGLMEAGGAPPGRAVGAPGRGRRGVGVGAGSGARQDPSGSS